VVVVGVAGTVPEERDPRWVGQQGVESHSVVIGNHQMAGVAVAGVAVAGAVVGHQHWVLAYTWDDPRHVSLQ